MHKQVLHRGTLLIVTFVTGVKLATTTPAQAQPVSVPIFENVTISTKFSPNPLTVRGISGGSVPAKDITAKEETANGACIGFVDEKPDHTIVLTNFFKNLSLQVESSQDTTIVVRGPGGTWCNDDSEGKNPAITGEWLAGTYNIWVGSFEKTTYHPYLLRISESF